GAGWTDSTNWKTAAPLGEWYGVTTDTDGRVTEVDLYDNALAGWLPPALGSLTHLETLRLGDDELTGPIPAALGNVANLERLDLSWTELTGTIPGALGRLVNLRVLDLRGNHLTGPVPAGLGNLVNLERLSLGWNDLTGPIPAWLGNLPQLWRLALAGNEFSGRIPSALGSLTNLEALSLGWNELTGPVPASLGNLPQLSELSLGGNELTGSIPGSLGSLANLRWLDLSRSDLTGAIPSELGNLTNLEELDLSYTWGLSGPLPAGIEESGLERLDLMVTRTCAPAAWQEWLATIEFLGPLCGVEPDVTIDVAVVYTPTAREAAGGTAGIEAAIDLMVAETNEAYATSGVHQRVVLTGRSEVPYIETGGGLDLDRLQDPSDGYLDEAQALRDRTGADMVHLIVGDPDYTVCGIAFLPGLGSPGPFGVTLLQCGGIVFAHELGHNMGLLHDRFQTQVGEESVLSHPAYGYVNQRMFGTGAPPSSRWVTVMSYSTQCGLADARCSHAPRFSNPRLRYAGDPLGVAFGVGSGVTGAADAAAVLNATGPAMAALLDRPDRPNRAPVAVGTLPDRSLALAGTLDVDVSQAFDDPDGDPLTYAVSSSAPDVVAVRALGPGVTLTAVGFGRAAIEVTATDPGGLSATRTFEVVVTAPFTDDPLQPGVTPIKAVHFMELRARIDALRSRGGLSAFRWTDPIIQAGVTPVKLVHLLELRDALAAAYLAAGRAAPHWTEAAPVAETTPIRAAHLTELRAAVVALE
ncbi:MAG: M12 family metallo-peptidase, partial [Acidobacteria bacterium]|nr:M12 family metallo-peptidase [Acidobacteriota bacterium]